MGIRRTIFSAVVALTALFSSAKAQVILDSELMIEPIVQQSRQFTGITFLAQDRFLLTEKMSGNVRLYENGVLLADPVLTVPVPAVIGAHDGLLGVVKDPRFAENNYVYFYYTREGTGGNPNMDRIARFTWTGNAFDPDSEFVLRELIGTPDFHHGGSMVFGPDETLYLVTGDRGRSEQTTNHATGGPNDVAVILHLNRDGTPAANNPFDTPGWEYIFGYGVRNSFGLAVDPITCNVWNTENGTGEGFEELNLYRPGTNGGWNKFIGIANPDPSELFLMPGAEYIEPKLQFRGVPTAIVFQPCPVLGAANWNRMFMGFFVPDDTPQLDAIWRITLNSQRDRLAVQSPDLQDSIVSRSEDVSEFGFVRQLPWVTDMEIGPDGFLYVLRYASPSVFRVRPNHPTCDANSDGDLDLHDFLTMQDCFSGSEPEVPVSPSCRQIVDVNEDTVIDAADFTALSTVFSGPLPPR